MTRVALSLALLTVACGPEAGPVDLDEDAFARESIPQPAPGLSPAPMLRAGETCGDGVDNDRDARVDEGCRSTGGFWGRLGSIPQFSMGSDGGLVDQPDPDAPEGGDPSDPDGPWTGFPQPGGWLSAPATYLVKADAIPAIASGVPLAEVFSTLVLSHERDLGTDRADQALGAMLPARGVGADLVLGLPGLSAIGIYANPGDYLWTNEAQVWLVGPAGTDWGTSFRVADFDRDGYDDVAVALPEEDSTFIAYGPFDTHLEYEDFDVQIKGAGVAVHSAGDFDGDRVSDLLLEGRYGMAVLPGGRAYSGRVDAQEMPFYADFGYYGAPDAVVGDFDLNGDGRSEVALSYSRYNAIVAWEGGREGRFGAVQGYYTIIQSRTGDGLGASLAAADIDGDGDNELLAGAPYADYLRDEVGAVYAFPQVAAGRFDAKYGTALVGSEAHQQLGHRIAVADYDRDGYDDLLINGREQMAYAESNQPLWSGYDFGIGTYDPSKSRF